MILLQFNVLMILVLHTQIFAQFSMMLSSLILFQRANLHMKFCLLMMTMLWTNMMVKLILVISMLEHLIVLLHFILAYFIYI